MFACILFPSHSLCCQDIFCVCYFSTIKHERLYGWFFKLLHSTVSTLDKNKTNDCCLEPMNRYTSYALVSKNHDRRPSTSLGYCFIQILDGKNEGIWDCCMKGAVTKNYAGPLWSDTPEKGWAGLGRTSTVTLLSPKPLLTNKQEHDFLTKDSNKDRPSWRPQERVCW